MNWPSKNSLVLHLPDAINGLTDAHYHVDQPDDIYDESFMVQIPYETTALQWIRNILIGYPLNRLMWDEALVSTQ